MKLLSMISAVLLGAITVVAGDFFDCPADTGANLPADKVYPKGRIFPIMTYSGKVAGLRNDGFTVVGPVYGKHNLAVYKNAGTQPIIFSIRAKQDNCPVDKKFFRQKNVKLDPAKVSANIQEIVKKAIAEYPSIAFFYLTPEELRHWKDSEYDFIRIAIDAIHAADPEKRPVWMYLPGHYGQSSLNKYADRQDVLGKGTYTNYSGFKNNRVWVRHSVEILKNAAAAGNEVEFVLAVLEMFRKPENAEIPLIPEWARHDFYAALISGAKGLAIFSLSNRRGFGAAHKLYYSAYSKAAKEITGENGLGEIFLFGERRDDLVWKVSSGPAEIKLQIPAVVKKNSKREPVFYPYASVGIANIAHARGRYLFMVNSANTDVAGTVSGFPAGCVIRDAVSGAVIGKAEQGSFELKFKPLEVKLFKLERNMK